MNTPIDPDALTPLEPLLADPDVTEIMIDGYQRIYVERHGRFEDVPTPFRDDEHLKEVINVIVSSLGRTVNESAPLFDARLSDGSRVNVVLPPVSLIGPVLTLRKIIIKPLTVEDLLRFGSWSEAMVEFLRACVHSRLNMVMAGGTGSGKTTVLNLIARMIPDDERIIIVENAAEMQVDKKRLIRLESRPPNREGKGEVTVRDLLINALRMRPDRIILGEARSAEVLDLLQAMDTGHDGSLTSLHANSVRDAAARLEMMATHAEFSIPLLTVRKMIASAIDIIIHQARLKDGSRKILNITEVVGMKGDVIELADIFTFRQTGVQDGRVTGHFTATGIIPKSLERIRDAGIELPLSMFTPS